VAVLPAGGICDSNSEEFAFRVKELKAGPHRIAVRVEDVYGNAGYGVVEVATGK